MSRNIITTIAAAAAFAGVAAPAHASTYICVPAEAGAAIVSGGAEGTCEGEATVVQMPSSAADQQALIDLLPYVKVHTGFDGMDDIANKSTVIGDKPTIVFSGANVQLYNGDVEGTGNLVVGDPKRVHFATDSSRTGSHNLVVGRGNDWRGNGNLIAGAGNIASGSNGFAAGYENATNGQFSLAVGDHNTANGDAQAIGGRWNKATHRNSQIFGGHFLSSTADGSRLFGGSRTYWAKFSATALRSSSEKPFAAYAYGGYGFNYIAFKDVDPTKCSVNVTIATASNRYRSVTGNYNIIDQYVLAYAMDPSGNWVKDVPMDVSITCSDTTHQP